MADIIAKRTHTMGLDAARKTAEKLAEKLEKDFQLDSQWVGNQLKFTRSGVKGALDVTDKEVSIEISLGFMLKAFKGKIQSEIDQNLAKLFS